MKRIGKEIEAETTFDKYKKTITRTKTGLDITRFLFRSTKTLDRWFFAGPDKILNGIATPKASERLIKSGGAQEYHLEQVNVYMTKQLTRLHKYALAGKDTRFQSLAFILTMKSRLFRMYMLERATKGGWKLSEKEQVEAFKQSDYLFGIGASNFKFKRVGIPKPDGTLRPLAVPTKAGRIVSRGYLELMEIGIQPFGYVAIAKNQFGGVMRQSTAGAGEHIGNKIINKKFVYEFDLNKCFDSIYHHVVGLRIMELQTPDFLHNFIKGCIETAHENLDEIENQIESDAVGKKNSQGIEELIDETYSGGERTGERLKGRPKNEEGKEILRWERRYNIECMQKHLKKTFPDLKIDTNLMDEYPELALVGRNYVHPSKRSIGVDDIQGKPGPEIRRGIPQGGAFSPLITNLLMNKVIPETCEGVLYLDDGIIAADSLEDLDQMGLIENLMYLGLTLSPEKSNFIKGRGQWKRTMKFLGIKTEGKEMGASTRKGATQVMGLPDLAKVRLNSSLGQQIPQSSEQYNEAIKQMMQAPITTAYDPKAHGPINELAVAHMYNDGKIMNAKGDGVEWKLEENGVQSLRTRAMSKWMGDYPNEALKFLEGVKRHLDPSHAANEQFKPGSAKNYIKVLSMQRRIKRRLSNNEVASS